ncbi:MAG: hypothetical protein JWO33_541 [Caulobacteraceae bacterium]|nr:hypothetical protein [Caulobacteraceae bacterium]
MLALTAFAAAAVISAAPIPVAAQDNRAAVLRWYQAFHRNDPALLSQILAPEWMDIPSPPGATPGPAGARGALAMLHATFADFAIVVDDVVQEGDKIVVRATMSGVQRAPFAGVPSKGRGIRIQVVDIHEVRDGKIVRTWHTEDWLTGLGQMGALQPPKPTAR